MRVSNNVSVKVPVFDLNYEDEVKAEIKNIRKINVEKDGPIGLFGQIKEDAVKVVNNRRKENLSQIIVAAESSESMEDVKEVLISFLKGFEKEMV